MSTPDPTASLDPAEIDARVDQAQDLARALGAFARLGALGIQADVGVQGALLMTALGLVVTQLFREHLANGGHPDAVNAWLTTVREAVDTAPTPTPLVRETPHVH